MTSGFLFLLVRRVFKRKILFTLEWSKNKKKTHILLSTLRYVQGWKCGTFCSSFYLVHGSDPGPVHKTSGAGARVPVPMENAGTRWVISKHGQPLSPASFPPGCLDGLFSAHFCILEFLKIIFLWIFLKVNVGRLELVSDVLNLASKLYKLAAPS